MIQVEPGLAAAALFSERAPAHIQLLLAAVLVHDVRVTCIAHGTGPFDVGRRRRAILMIEDDPPERSLGPGAFDTPSLARAVRGATHGVVVSCAPLPEIYADVALTAACGGRLVVIETRPEWEIAWIAFVQAHHPDLPLKIGTVQGGRA
jgi:transposase InsO family protein